MDFTLQGEEALAHVLLHLFLKKTRLPLLLKFTYIFVGWAPSVVTNISLCSH